MDWIFPLFCSLRNSSFVHYLYYRKSRSKKRPTEIRFSLFSLSKSVKVTPSGSFFPVRAAAKPLRGGCFPSFFLFRLRLPLSALYPGTKTSNSFPPHKIPSVCGVCCSSKKAKSRPARPAHRNRTAQLFLFFVFLHQNIEMIYSPVHANTMPSAESSVSPVPAVLTKEPDSSGSNRSKSPSTSNT